MSTITTALINEDASKEIRDEASSHVDTLFALATTKAEYYAVTIKEELLGAGQGTDKTFPISSIQSFIYETRAYTENNADNISSIVNDSIAGFVDGEYVGAVQTIVTGFVTSLLGGSSGAQQEKKSYFAVLEGVSMVRYDFAGWSKQITSVAMTERLDSLSAYVLYKSIVDMSKVTLSGFTSVYQHTVKAENPELDLEGIIEKCKQLFYLFNPLPPPSDSASFQPKKSSFQPKKPSFQLKKSSFQPSKGHKTVDIFREDIVIL